MAALLCCLTLGPAAAATLQVVAQGGQVLTHDDIAEGDEWCLSWNHSVTGGAVCDCFALRNGQMVLDRSYLHDFAAGLGEVAGRGHIEPAKEGGYWILDIAEPIVGNALALRVGKPAVDHRLTVGGHVHALSELVAGARVVLTLTDTP